MEQVIEISKLKTSFGNPIELELLPEKQMSRIKFKLQRVSVFNEKDWQKKCLALLGNTFQIFKPLSKNQFNC